MAKTIQAKTTFEVFTGCDTEGHSNLYIRTTGGVYLAGNAVEKIAVLLEEHLRYTGPKGFYLEVKKP